MSGISPIRRMRQWVLSRLPREPLPPYEYVQWLAERHLAAYLAKPPEAVRLIAIVGGYHAFEVDRMLARYPNARFIVFEPSQRYFEILQGRFQNQPRVQCVQLAVADFIGTAEFFETTLEGSGSLLKSAPAAERDYNLKPAESFTVNVTTLDEFLSRMQPPLAELDLLWCDVQGAELKVLAGGEKVLERCGALFLEVTAWESTYEGGVLYGEIVSVLARKGFVPCGLGLDSLNGTGNALFVHPQHRGQTRQKL